MKGTVRKDEATSTWNYLVCIGKDKKTNKYKYKRKRGFKTKRECEAALAKVICEYEQGTLVDNEKMTVAEYLDYWMETYVKNNCAFSTYKRYSFSVNDIKEHIGYIKLTKLNPLIIEKMYKDIIEETKQSQNTLIKTHRTFHLALKHAQQWQLINNNPCDLVNKPKTIKKDIEYWHPDLVKENLNKLKGHRLYNIIFLACHTGMRVGELCGLRWENVDLKNGIIHVREQLQRIDKELKLVSLKTENSIRDIALYPQTIKFLKQLRKIFLNSDYVFSWEDGRPFDPHYVSQNFSKALTLCGIEDKITFHGLRHTHATMLLAAGVNEKTISERLGHSTVSFTMDIYTHVNLDMQKQEIKKAINLF